MEGPQEAQMEEGKPELNFSSINPVAPRGVETAAGQVINFPTAENRGEVSTATATPAGAEAAL